MPLNRNPQSEDIETALGHLDDMSQRFGGHAVIMVFGEGDDSSDTFIVSRIPGSELVRLLCAWVGCRISEYTAQLGRRAAGRPDYDA